jgi:hypothetical protein
MLGIRFSAAKSTMSFSHVFQGTPGRSRHATSDFVHFAKAKGLTKSDRRYLTALRTGVNEAWVETVGRHQVRPEETGGGNDLLDFDPAQAPLETGRCDDGATRPEP